MAVSRNFQRSRSGINNDSHLAVKVAGLGAAAGHYRRIPRSHRGDLEIAAQLSVAARNVVANSIPPVST